MVDRYAVLRQQISVITDQILELHADLEPFMAELDELNEMRTALIPADAPFEIRDQCGTVLYELTGADDAWQLLYDAGVVAE